MEKLVAIPTIGLSGLVLEGKKGLVGSILFEGASMSISRSPKRLLGGEFGRVISILTG